MNYARKSINGAQKRINGARKKIYKIFNEKYTKIFFGARRDPFGHNKIKN
jgi:hypothetical protein